MIYIEKNANTEVNQLEMVGGEVDIVLPLGRKLTNKPIIFVEILSNQTLSYSLQEDKERNSFILSLKDGEQFDLGDKVNYFVVYL